MKNSFKTSKEYRQIMGIFGGFAVILFFTTGLYEPVLKVIIWLVSLNINSPDISLGGQIITKYGTWVLTYSLVGIVFRWLGWFNSDAMKIAYFIISTIISFALSWVMMILETYSTIIAIIIGATAIAVVAGIIIARIIIKQKKLKEVIESA